MTKRVAKINPLTKRMLSFTHPTCVCKDEKWAAGVGLEPGNLLIFLLIFLLENVCFSIDFSSDIVIDFNGFKSNKNI